MDLHLLVGSIWKLACSLSFSPQCGVEILILCFPCSGGVGTTRHLHPTDILGVGVCADDQGPFRLSNLGSSGLLACLHHRIMGTAGIPTSRETLVFIHPPSPLGNGVAVETGLRVVAFADAIVMGQGCRGILFTPHSLCTAALQTIIPPPPPPPPEYLVVAT
ncbi:hypothetical protein CGRA01v4_10619 [Colletotrichum graminicola]|nr:hypothetical protein CGRA01v4_10619 [Colletotrichum graminicola]